MIHHNYFNDAVVYLYLLLIIIITISIIYQRVAVVRHSKHGMCVHETKGHSILDNILSPAFAVSANDGVGPLLYVCRVLDSSGAAFDATYQPIECSCYKEFNFMDAFPSSLEMSSSTCRMHICIYILDLHVLYIVYIHIYIYICLMSYILLVLCVFGRFRDLFI